MKIAITGSSGAIGKLLIPILEATGNEIIKFVRREPKNDREAYWNPSKRTIDMDVFQKVDAIIHLAGEPIAPLSILGFLPFSGQRWNKEKRNNIYWSRKLAAETFIEAYRNSDHYPKVFISASAVGIYGNQEDRIIDEDSSYIRGTFDQYVAEEGCEKSLEELKVFNVRLVFARTGIVLGPTMPIVEILKFVWNLNIGGSVGGGNQYWPWVAIEDVLDGYLFSLKNKQIKGPVNLVSPTPIKQKDFSKLLAQEMKKIAILPIPAFVIKLAIGRELAEALVLSSRRVLPSKLLRYGYEFKQEYLNDYIKEIIDHE